MKRRHLCRLGLAVLALTAAGTLSASTSAHGMLTRCHTAELSGRLGFIQGAAGSRFGPLRLTNRSHRICTLEGYIGGLLYSSTGRALPTRIVRDHTRPVAVVTLRPGQAAFTTLHWSVIPTGASGCPAPRSFAVTPPDERTQLRVRWTAGRVCSGGRVDVRPLRR